MKGIQSSPKQKKRLSLGWWMVSIRGITLHFVVFNAITISPDLSLLSLRLNSPRVAQCKVVGNPKLSPVLSKLLQFQWKG